MRALLVGLLLWVLSVPGVGRAIAGEDTDLDTSSRTICVLGFCASSGTPMEHLSDLGACFGGGDKANLGAACRRLIERKEMKSRDRAEAHQWLGFYHSTINQPRQAIEQYDKSLAIHPRNSLAYFFRALLHLELGRREQALVDLARAETSPALRENDLLGEALKKSAKEQIDEMLRNGPPKPKVARSPEAGKAVAAVAPPVVVRRPPERRVALVIGNAGYGGGTFEPLKTPHADASAVAGPLKRVGFRDEDVLLRQDLDRKGLIAALREFETRARGSDWALVFFAGHGVRARSNLDYLIPIDAQITHERDLPDEAVGLERVVERIGDAKKLQMVIFDACRSNELTRRLVSTSEPTRSAAAVAAPFEAASLIVAFAARRGQPAFDGQTHSPFVTALLAQVERPNLDVETMFMNIASDVRRATGDKQIPEIYGLGRGKGLRLKQDLVAPPAK